MNLLKAQSLLTAQSAKSHMLKAQSSKPSSLFIIHLHLHLHLYPSPSSSLIIQHPAVIISSICYLLSVICPFLLSSVICHSLR
jgi:hypothetical protein